MLFGNLNTNYASIIIIIQQADVNLPVAQADHQTTKFNNHFSPNFPAIIRYTRKMIIIMQGELSLMTSVLEHCKLSQALPPYCMALRSHSSLAVVVPNAQNCCSIRLLSEIMTSFLPVQPYSQSIQSSKHPNQSSQHRLSVCMIIISITLCVYFALAIS